MGSKVIARIVPERTQKWSEPWLHKSQCGFRKRGVDDVLQVSRRVVEEGARDNNEGRVIRIRLFDILKAYPKVSKDALWEVMRRRGAPKQFISPSPPNIA